MKNEGQSLIETIVAIFVLVTGLSAGLSLAIFAFGASSDIAEKIVATGLAREGIEGVRRMRDSNWLWGRQNGQLANCPELGSGQLCYRNWLTNPYDIRGTQSGTDYRLVFDPSAAANKWTLGQSANYRLSNYSSAGLSHLGSTALHYYRKITVINQNTNDPALETRVLVRSVVWWHGKGCAPITNFTAPSDTNCKIITEEYLENWKNY